MADLGISVGVDGIGAFERDMNRASSATRTASASMEVSLKRIATQVGAAFAVNKIKDYAVSAVGSFATFEQAQADLSAITGATGKDLEYFGEQAETMGLKIEGGGAAALKAFETIGSLKPELLKSKEALVDMTKWAETLAEASGMELPDAAKSAASALNQYGESASQAGKFVNVLAAGALEGASAIPASTAALEQFGSVAKGFNVTIEESIAAVQTLADKSVFGAEAGVGIRNIQIIMQGIKGIDKKALEDLNRLGVNLDIVSNSALPFKDRLKELSKIMGDSIAPTHVFGRENVNVGTILLGNIDRFADLTTKITGTDVATQQATTRTATLRYAMIKLKSSIEAAFKNVGEFLAPFVRTLTGLPEFVSENSRAFKALGLAIATVGGAFVAYKVAVAAAGAIQVWYTSLTWSLQVAQLALATGTNIVTGALEALRIVMASNPWTVALVAIAAVAGAIYALTGGTKELTAAQKLELDLNERVSKAYGEAAADANMLFGTLNSVQKGSKQYSEAIAEINKQYGQYLPNQLTDASNLDEIAKAQRAVNEGIMAEIRLQVKKQKITELTTAHLDKSMQAQLAISKATGLSNAQLEAATAELGKYTKGMGEAFLKEEAGAAIITGSSKDLIESLALNQNLSESTRKTLASVAESGKGASSLMALLAAETGLYGQELDQINAFFAGDENPIAKITDEAKKAKEGMGGLGEATKKYAVGSIAYLEDQLSKLSTKFKETNSEAKRFGFAREIEATEFALAKLTQSLDYMGTKAASAFKATKALVKDIADLPQRTAETDDPFKPLLDSMENGLPKLSEFAARMKGVFVGLGQSVKNTMVQMGADVAFGIGEAIGSGGSIGDVFKKALRELAVMVPKMVGMALLNEAATVPSPASLPLAVAGLALIGASGILSGVFKAADKRKEALPTMTPSASTAAANTQTGISAFVENGATNLGQTIVEAFSGATFLLNADGVGFRVAVANANKNTAIAKGK